jgi:hypothetical protein
VWSDGVVFLTASVGLLGFVVIMVSIVLRANGLGGPSALTFVLAVVRVATFVTANDFTVSDGIGTVMAR